MLLRASALMLMFFCLAPMPFAGGHDVDFATPLDAAAIAADAADDTTLHICQPR